jgi:dolichyl-diphosphooligosaccharide--protein glycosyltransferase
MVNHGWRAFQAWFDDGVWYPLGRHVGSTTYPGLQLTAWGIHSALHAAGYPASLNDVCVFIPAGFGALAAGVTGLLAWEVTRKPNAAVAATAIMAILPAHLMRSIAGGYDNESIAISAMVTTFYLWVRALRDDGSWPAAVLCGLAYTYMVAAWGGYVFVLNMIGLHASALVLVGWFSPRLWRAYTLWFLIGTAGAIFGPARYLVGWQPFQSLEQLGPTAVFFGLQLWQLTEYLALRRKLDATNKLLLRLKLFGYAGIAVAAAGALLLPEGFIGPLSARVRGLFIKHTKTGNPLVDSVAEHQVRFLVLFFVSEPPIWACFFLACTCQIEPETATCSPQAV